MLPGQCRENIHKNLFPALCFGVKDLGNEMGFFTLRTGPMEV